MAESSLENSWQVEFRRGFSEVSSSDWDRCAGPANPFLSYGFLSALEDSGCIGRGTSWLPFPALLRRHSQGPVLGVAPCFVKLDSKGEYIFDYSWADAYDRLFGQTRGYYPKLQIAVPFTPVPGERLLVDPSLDERQRREAKLALLSSFLELAQRNDLSSVHLTFAQAEEVALACLEGRYLPRLGEQYHWLNAGYANFEEFLADLSSRKRKAIRRERRIAQSHPLSLHTIHGSQVSQQQWGAFYEMYLQTSQQKWGQPYLNLEFFRLLSQRLKDKVVLMLVRSELTGAWVAGAWNLRGQDALFGRNWGCLEDFDMLHFEVCYYRAIDYAITHGLHRVEAGAQGLHKIQRGYRPVEIHSAHYLREPAFAKLVADYLADERHQERQRLSALEELTPFRRASENKSP